MAGTVKGISIEIDGNTKPLTSALKSLNTETNKTANELRQVEKLLQFDPDNVVLLEQKQDLLTKSISDSNAKLEILKNTQSKVNSEMANGTEINQAEFRKLQREIETTESNLKKLGDKATESASKFEQFEQTGKIMATTAAGALAVGAGVLGLAESTKEYNTQMAILEQNSISANQSFEQTERELKELSRVSDDVGANVEAVSNILKAGFTDTDLTRILNELSGAVIEFPDTLKIEGLADGLQETLATGTAAGSFAELLERLGYNLEDFEKGLTKATKAGTQQEYILDYLSKSGLSSLNAEYEKNNENLIDNADANFELQAAYAELGETALPIATALTEVMTTLITWILENKDTVILFISMFGAGLIALNVVSMLQSLIAAFGLLKGIIAGTTTTQQLLNTAMNANPIGIVISLLAALGAALVYLYNTNEDFRNAINELWKSLKDTVGWYIEGISNIIGGVIDKIKDAINWFNQLFDKSSKAGSITTGADDYSVPFFANGGTLIKGSGVVGEAGAELLTISNGRATIQPLNGQQTAFTNQTNSNNSNQPLIGQIVFNEATEEAANRIINKIDNELGKRIK